MKLKSGQSADPLPRLSPDELREELIAENKSLPVYLGEDDYREWLDHTVMARTQRGEEALDKAREALKELAAPIPTVARMSSWSCPRSIGRSSRSNTAC